MLQTSSFHKIGCLPSICSQFSLYHLSLVLLNRIVHDPILFIWCLTSNLCTDYENSSGKV